MEITIREVRGKFVACLPGSERIGPTVGTHTEALAQVSEYIRLHDIETDATVTDVASTVEGKIAPAAETELLDELDKAAGRELPGKAIERDDVPEGHFLRRVGLWYKLFDANGEQVGKSQRKPADAVALAG